MILRKLVTPIWMVVVLIKRTLKGYDCDWWLERGWEEILSNGFDSKVS